MATSLRRRLGHRWRGGQLLAVAAWTQVAMAGEPAAAPTELREHLAAGEFAPALAIAKRAPAKERDVLLGKVAAAQAAAGGRGQALATAGSMSSDSLRDVAVRDAIGGSAARGPGNRGGGTAADFDSLIELITSTVAPTTWDSVGGPGSVAPYAGGVWVDARGMLHKAIVDDAAGGLDGLRRDAAIGSTKGDVAKSSALRKVSLSRLERAVQLQLAGGKPLDEAMTVLAGLQRIEYVLAYPETGDVVLAGPAGDWTTDREGRLVAAAGGQPVLRLDDLAVVLRDAWSHEGHVFGCSITPRQEALARTKAFVEESNRRPLKANGRGAWLEQMRSQLGRQDIEYYGLDPRTRVAHVLVEADYRMKLVGIGLEDGVLGVPSYLATLVHGKNAGHPVGVVRWWFAMNYQAVVRSADRQAYQLRGNGVQVLSENEWLTATGQRVHTGQSDEPTAEFAHAFTEHFPALAEKYPVYGELRNIFDLVLAATLIKAENLADRAGWQPTCLLDNEQFPVATADAPQEVETVVNHKLADKTRIVAVVSGGVRVDPHAFVKSAALQSDTSGQLSSRHASGAPGKLPRENWWWD